ncbi:MAG: hypothetical protein CVU42_11790 [Chloroflexi bacterium HGW-Chloroflexi-4]|jgi:hypothetical protein|nr:MAG: hypothetical protein CVU42_11790 [Chloroflexi bacterium HGW-Chloroflexi-4]
MSNLINLENKFISPDRIAEMAIDNPALLNELLAGISPQSQKSTRRENSSQAMMFMAETWPEILVPHWDYFVSLFNSPNGFSKYVAIYVIASLTKIAPEKFVANTEVYFSLLDDDSVMVASHAALNAAKIAQNCPSHQTEIIQRLLGVDNTHHDPNHLGLLKAYVIEALNALYPNTANQKEILNFVKAQIDSSSPKTGKMAKAFLKKYTG